ncbi:hypothetical protein CXF38_03995 [Corynebacterium bovis]|nr:hypothetical protein CXF38_03995 [Corynebacterium bovis]
MARRDAPRGVLLRGVPAGGGGGRGGRPGPVRVHRLPHPQPGDGRGDVPVGDVAVAAEGAGPVAALLPRRCGDAGDVDGRRRAGLLDRRRVPAAAHARQSRRECRRGGVAAGLHRRVVAPGDQDRVTGRGYTVTDPRPVPPGLDGPRDRHRPGDAGGGAARRVRLQHPDRIIVGAISAFLDGGVADTPVEEIARRAGVGKGSVFYTFGSRDRLVEVVLMTLVDVVSARVAEVRAAARGWEALEAVVRSSVELVVHNPRIAHTVFAELTRPDRKWRAALDHARGQLFRPVEEILDEVAAGGAAAGDGGGAGGSTGRGARSAVAAAVIGGVVVVGMDLALGAGDATDTAGDTADTAAAADRTVDRVCADIMMVFAGIRP